MGIWTVFKVTSLLNGGAGQSLLKLGTVEAPDFSAALEKAHEAFPFDANPSLPQGGLTVIASRFAA